MSRTPIDGPLNQEVVLDHLMEGVGIALDVRADRMFVTDLAGSIIDQQWFPTPADADASVLSLSINRVGLTVYMAALSDVTRIARQDLALYADRRRFRAIIDNLPDCAIFTVTLAGLIDDWNRSLERYGGWSSLDVVGKGLGLFWAPRDLATRPVDALLDEARTIGSVRIEGWQLKRDGSRLWGETVITALPDPTGAITGFLVVSRDMTERKHKLDELNRPATVDPLTGAFNRQQGDILLRLEMAARERRGRPFAVLMLDIDYFKAINERYGHAAGDRVLKALTDVCTASLRAEDAVFRWGGEEFMLFIADSTPMVAMKVAERVRAALAATSVSAPDGELIRFTVSIGVAGAIGETPGELVNRANGALRTAKSAGRNQVVLAA